jgi:hypothetical protein
MAQVQIGQNDIASLSRKLMAIEPQLTEPERVLLLLLISFAAKATGAGTGTASDELGSYGREQDALVFVVEIDETRRLSIHEQFANAFTPGAVGRYRIRPGTFGPAPR